MRIPKIRLNRTQVAWAFYDWANSAFATTILAAVLPAYYTRFVAASLSPSVRTAYWAYTNFAAAVLVALTAPFLGGIADRSCSRKKFWISFALLGILATAALYFVETGQIFRASLTFVIAMFGFSASELFYNSFLIDVAEGRESDFVSNLGYALGYVGGGLLLALNVLMILNFKALGLNSHAHAMRLSFVSVAVWWLVFSIPSWTSVREEGCVGLPLSKAMLSGVRRIEEIFKELLRHRNALLFLIAFWVYNDGIVTIVKMAVAYGVELGIGESELIKAILLVQFVAAPFALMFGLATKFVRTKHALIFALLIYGVISVFGYKMQSAKDFYILALMVATVQGGAQALSRSLFSRLIPKDRKAEFFGFFSLSGKFSSVLGPLMVGLIAQVSGSGRNGALFLLVLFGLGIAILLKVKE